MGETLFRYRVSEGEISYQSRGDSVSGETSHRQRSQTRDATDEQSLMVEDDPCPVGRRSKRISPRRKAYVVRRWYMLIVERPVTVRPRSLCWPASAALQLLASGGMQSS